MHTIYLEDTNQVSITCQNCGLEHDIDTTKLVDAQNKLEGKCTCGEPYQFNIEFRQRYRKEVSLSGEYIFPGINHKEDITIRELSFTGIQFESLNPYKINENDLLEVKFKLDNPLKPNIRKLVKIIWIRGQIIGAQFIETKLFEEELKSYVRN